MTRMVAVFLLLARAPAALLGGQETERPAERAVVPTTGMAGDTVEAGRAMAGDPARLPRAQQDVFRRAVAEVAPSVVTIETIGGTQPPARVMPATGPAGDRRPNPGTISPTGSSFIIGDGPTTGLVYSAEGLILTSAFNFVRDPSLITVVLPDGRRFVGELLARDEVRRLAMLKIDATGLPVPTWVEGSGAIRVGQWALALGRGFGGTECSISIGTISGLNRQSGLAVQTDAKLSPANFGGPLIDTQGRVIGICVPMGVGGGPTTGVEWYDSGIGFAIPHQQAAASAEALAVGHSLRRGLLGVHIDLRATDAVRVARIPDPSPARRAGVQIGDEIIAIDGQPVSSQADLERIMAGRFAGEWVKLSLRRAGRQIEQELRLAVPEDLGPVRGDAGPVPGDLGPVPEDSPPPQGRSRRN